MNIFILMTGDSYETYSVHRVFTNRDVAEKYLLELEEDSPENMSEIVVLRVTEE